MNEVQKAIQVTKAATQLMKEIQKVPLSPPVPKPGISQTPIKQAQPGFKAPEKGVVKGLFTHHGKEIKEHRKKYGDEFNTDEDYHDYGHARREVNRNWNDKESHSDAAAGLKEMTKATRTEKMSQHAVKTGDKTRAGLVEHVREHGSERDNYNSPTNRDVASENAKKRADSFGKAKKNIPDVPMRQAKPPDKKAEWAKKPSAGAWMDKAEKSKEEEEEHEKKESKKEEEEEVDKGSQKMPGDKREPGVKPAEGKESSTRAEDTKGGIKKALAELHKSMELISNLNKAYSSTRQGQEKWTKMRPQLAPGSKRDKIAEIVGNKTK